MELDPEVKRVEEQREMRREYMTLEMEIRKQREDAMAIGMEKGRTEGQALSALGMLKRGMDMNVISQCTQLSLDAIKKLAKQNKLI